LIIVLLFGGRIIVVRERFGFLSEQLSVFTFFFDYQYFFIFQGKGVGAFFMTAFIFLSFLFVFKILLQFCYFSIDCGKGLTRFFEAIGEHINLIIDPFFDTVFYVGGLFDNLLVR
jgi:hypothetical protein